MKKDVLIIAQYTQAPGEFENDRFKYLAQMLVNQYDADVEVVTMDFSHHRKQRRHVPEAQKRLFGYEMTFVHVTAYTKNVSVRRLFSNHVLGINLKKYLGNRKKPDVVYVAVPSLEVGKAAVDYCLKHHVKCIVDIQDVWPEAFRMSFNVPGLSNLLFAPMEKMADYIYSNADQIVAVSRTYAERAFRVNHKSITPLVVFLGTELAAFDAIPPAERDADHITLAYVGTLGASYDLTDTIDAVAELNRAGLNRLKLLVMGDGLDRERLESRATAAGITYEFTGRLPYDQMAARLKCCDIAINPIYENAPQSIINKHADYAAASLPVVNTQRCREYIDLLEEYGAGIHCEHGTKDEIAEAVRRLAADADLRKRMGKGSRRMAEERFDRKAAYPEIADEICGKRRSRASS